MYLSCNSGYSLYIGERTNYINGQSTRSAAISTSGGTSHDLGTVSIGGLSPSTSYTITGNFNINANISGSWKYWMNGSASFSTAAAYWNDINVYNPNGVQDSKSGYFDLYTSENNSWRYNLVNEDTDMTHTEGTYFQVQNIRPYYDYYELNYVSGHDSEPSSGVYRKTFNGADEVLHIYMKYKSYSVTVSKGTGIASVSRSASSVAYGSTATIDATVSTGYHWVNWTGTFTTSTKNYSWTMSNKSYSLTANAAANTYTVVYHGNGATGGSTANSSHTYNSAKNLTANGFTRTGYTFAGWNTAANGNGTSYSNSQSVSNLTSTHNGTVNLYAQWTINSYYLDLNGLLDGTASGGLSPHGYATVTVGGSVKGTAISDYYTQHPYNTSYSITNIGANWGYQYNGVSSGNLSGNIGAGTTAVQLNFTTKKPWDLTISGNVTGPFNIDLTWDATGLNITNYKVYANNVLIYDGTNTSYSFAAAEETTYNIYFVATNIGGSTTSGTVTYTTPADQAKIRRKADGQWVKGKTYYKKDGQWVKAKKIYIKVDGQWKIGTNYDS